MMYSLYTPVNNYTDMQTYKMRNGEQVEIPKQMYTQNTTKRLIKAKNPDEKNRTETVLVETPLISPEYIPILLDYFTDEKLQLTIRILIGTGLRYEEMNQISDKYFYPDNGYLTIKSTKAKAVRKSRDCYMSKDAAEAVRIWIDRKYTPMTRDGFFKNLKVFQSLTGIEITSKSFRKTHENYRLKIGHKPIEVAHDMGHTSRVQFDNYFSPTKFNEKQIELIKEIIK